MQIFILLLLLCNAFVGIAFSSLLLIFFHQYSLTRWLKKGKNILPEQASSSVAVIIAARNEETSISQTLTNFATLSGVSEVILIDDSSDDQTLFLGKAVAAQNPCIRILQAPALPPGWIGKTHALHWASKHTSAEFILFTDADVQFQEFPLVNMINIMNNQKLDHIGGNFKMEQTTLAEALTAPVLALFAFVSLGISACRQGSATGAFNLVRTSVYRNINGHLPIRDQLVDDVALARYIKQQGFRSQFLDLSPVLTVHLYDGLQGFISAVSRSAISFLGNRKFATLILSILASLISLTLVLIPCFLIVNLLVQPNNGLSDQLPTYTFAIAVYSFSTFPFVLAGRLFSCSRWWGLFSPVGLMIMTVSVFISTVRCALGLGIKWRGRVYPIANPPPKKL